MLKGHFHLWAVGSVLLLAAGLLSASPAPGPIDDQKIENILPTMIPFPKNLTRVLKIQK